MLVRRSTPNLLCVAWRSVVWHEEASCRLCWSPVQLANYLKCFKLFTLFVVKFYKQNKNICSGSLHDVHRKQAVQIVIMLLLLILLLFLIGLFIWLRLLGSHNALHGAQKSTSLALSLSLSHFVVCLPLSAPLTLYPHCVALSIAFLCYYGVTVNP